MFKTIGLVLLTVVSLFGLDAQAASERSKIAARDCDLSLAILYLRQDIAEARETGREDDEAHFLMSEIYRRYLNESGSKAEEDKISWPYKLGRKIGGNKPAPVCVVDIQPKQQGSEVILGRFSEGFPPLSSSPNFASSKTVFSNPLGGFDMFSITFSIILFFVSLCGVAGIRVVNQQTILVVETFGKFSRTLKPGINYIFFPIQSIAGAVSLKIESIKAQIEIKTSDNQFVHLPVDLMLVVNEDRAQDAFYKLHDAHDQIRSWVLNTVRSTAAGMTLKELYNDKDTIVVGVRNALEQTLREFGFRIENVLVDQPVVSEKVQESFNRVVSAEREKEAAEHEGEAVKIRMVKQAEAESAAQERRAEGVSAARKILAKGLQESIDEFHGVDADMAIQVLLQTSRIDAIRDVGKKGNLVLMDLQPGVNGNALMPLLSGLVKKEPTE